MSYFFKIAQKRKLLSRSFSTRFSSFSFFFFFFCRKKCIFQYPCVASIAWKKPSNKVDYKKNVFDQFWRVQFIVSNTGPSKAVSEQKNLQLPLLKSNFCNRMCPFMTNENHQTFHYTISFVINSLILVDRG